MDDGNIPIENKNEISSPPKDISKAEKLHGEVSTIVQILQKPAPDRRESDIKLLMNYTKDLEFFLKLNKKSQYANTTHKQICKAMFSQKYQKNQTIINYGDSPKFFYIILSGECLIMIPKSEDFKLTQTQTFTELQRLATLMGNQDKDNITNKKLQILQWRMSVEFADTLETWEAIENGKIVYTPEFLGANLGGMEKSKYDPRRFFDVHTGVLNFFCVSELGEGAVFGEMGLIQVSARKATVVAKNDLV
jgi:CRP-like cAMP-binding protein